MRNLFAFFRRFRLFLVFAILQIVALSMYMSYSEFARIQALTTTSEINGKMLSVRKDVTKHFSLEQTNRALQWENKRLRTQLKQSHYLVEKGKVSIDDTLYKQSYDYIPATVIQSTFDKRNNFMTIDIGKIHGVKRRLGVISSKGVIGIVHTVGDRFSLVKTILSKNINIDVMLKKGGAFGLLKWDAKSPKICQITGISNDMRVKRWTEVVTRGGSGIFPRGVSVGRVYKKQFIEGKPLWDLQIMLAEDFRAVQHVYVVKNILLQEIIEMENSIPVDKEEKEF